MNKKFVSASLVLVFLLIINCSKEHDYNSMIRKGLNSCIENNKLFLKYELGMSRDEFFAVSWEMNQEKIISGLVKVEYEFNDLENKALMRFYPEFENDRISKMPVDIHYVAWAPWNKDLSSDSLVVDLRKYYEDNHNADFKEVYVPSLEKKSLVSVKGNQAIIIYTVTDMVARLEFTDLNSFAG